MSVVLLPSLGVGPVSSLAICPIRAVSGSAAAFLAETKKTSGRLSASTNPALLHISTRVRVEQGLPGHGDTSMINPGRVDGSICGAVLSTKSATVWKLAGAATSTTGQRRLGSTVVASGTRQRARKPAGVYCPKSTSWLLSTFVPELESCSARRLPVYPRANVRFSSTESTAPRAATIEAIDESRTSHEALPTKGELLSYVSGVGGYSADERFDYHRDTYRRGYASPDGANVQISDRKGDVQYPNSTEIARASNATEELVARLCTAIRQRLRHPQRITLSSIYKIYCRLPEPRMLNLTWQWRNRLMKIMGTPRTKDKGGMIRYFELVADVRDAGLTMRRAEWNYGLAFAASYAATTTTQELDTTLQLWREMEKEHNLSGNDVTFNVLFDAASKAGNFVLAEMIYDEMESRGIEFNRYHHVSLIHFFGLKMDADGLRAAYKEMVDAGEMIDTVALNCVIAGLLRCGEEDAAEHTYDRMKEGNALAPDMPQRDYMLGRVITKVLMMFTKVGKAHPQMRNSFQTNVMVSPDIHTFRLLIEHYAIRIGDIGKVAQYLDEMKLLKIPVHPTIFLALFKGFFSYGGYEGSMWSAQRLQDVLNALYLARDQNTPNFQIDTWLVIWALRAVKKCSSLEDVVDTFAALEQRWDVVPNRQVYMHEVFDNILRDKDVKIKWRGLDSSKTRASQTKLIEF